MTIQDYGVKAALGKALSIATPLSNTLSNLAFRISSELGENMSENHIILGAPPAMREWKEKRQLRQLIQFPLKIENKLFETSVAWPVSWQRNDKTGLIDQAIANLQARYAQWPGVQVAGLINDGTTGLSGIDGKAYFADDHTWGGNTIDNLIGTDITTTTAPTAYEAAKIIMDDYQALMGFVDDTGDPCNEGMTDLTIVVRHTMAGAFKAAVLNQALDTGSGSVDNPLWGLRDQLRIHVIASPRITATGTSYAFNTTPTLGMPFVFQENLAERRITFKDDEHDNNRYEYGVKAVGGCGYGHFVHAVANVHV
jgi:phage major head subunit gpT-like protein